MPSNSNQTFILLCRRINNEGDRYIQLMCETCETEWDEVRWNVTCGRAREPRCRPGRVRCLRWRCTNGTTGTFRPLRPAPAYCTARSFACRCCICSKIKFHSIKNNFISFNYLTHFYVTISAYSYTKIIKLN